MRKRFACCIFLVLAAICLIIALVALRAPPPANLLVLAKKVAVVQDGSCFTRLSEHELLVLTYLSNRPPLKPAPYKLEIVDTATGARRPLAGLVAAIKRNGGEASVYGNSFSRSPDGQWFVWLDQKPGNRPAYLVSAHEDGSAYHRCTNMLAYPEAWLDDTHFVATLPNVVVTQQNVDHLPGIMVVDAATASVEHPLGALSPEGRALGLRQRQRLGYPAPGSANVVGERGSNAGEVLIHEYKSTNGVANNRIIDTLHFPRNIKVRDLYTNPSQTRVLIQFMDPQVPAYAAMVQWFFPNTHFAPEPIERLYVYNVPEGKLHDLGSVPRGLQYPAPNRDSEFSALSPHWLGSTNKIEFYCEQAVYVVDAD